MNVLLLSFVMSSIIKFNNVSKEKIEVIKTDYVQYMANIINEANLNYNTRVGNTDVETKFYLNTADQYTIDIPIVFHNEQFITENDSLNIISEEEYKDL